MKKIYLLCLFTVGYLFMAAQQPVVNNGMWTWINGDKIINVAGVYGFKGLANTANKPGARIGSVSWKDETGNMWLFGGQYIGYYYLSYISNPGLFNDLWKYNPGKNIWEWISGDSTTGQPGIYGQKGIAAAANKPGARKNAVSWTDPKGTFWLFGGTGYGAGDVSGLLNDLWQYTPQRGWAWMAGDSNVNVAGVYGTQYIEAAQNKPGGRTGATGWADAAGNCWLFGGMGYAQDTLRGSLNDLWKYNIQSNKWTWVSGTDLLNLPGVYGQKRVSTTESMPGSRQYAVSWIDKTGHLWLFGGQASTQQGSGALNDLWRFDVGKRYWTWMGGDNILNQATVYGILGVASASNKPGGRAASVSWLDAEGNFWLFGGAGYDINAEAGDLNDLWKFDRSTEDWTWMSGDRRIGITGIYGTEGIAAAGNKPGGRYFSAGWAGENDALWLFGGQGFAEQGSGYLNDLWRYNPYKPLSCPSSRVLPNDTFCALRIYNIDPVIPNASLNANYTLSGATTGTGSGTASGSAFNTGSTTVVYKLANDSNTTCAFVVEVDDRTAPVPVMDSLPVITGDCSVTVTDRPKAKDNCAGLITGTTNDSLTYTKHGTYAITWTYNDGHNNLTTQTQKLVVNGGAGTLTPLIENLPDITGECAVTITDIPLASKNCAGIFMATTADPLTYTKQGVYTVTWTYNDKNGSIVRQQQRIIVKDTIRPVPQKESLPDITGECSVTVTNRPTAVDNCAGTITGITSDSLTYTKQGTYIINWVYKDGNGNSTLQQQRLIVKPGSEPITPIVTTLPDITSGCSATITSVPQALGGCGKIIRAVTTDPLVYNKQGVYTITWRYADGNGNTASQEQKVIIKDSIAPVPVLQALPDIKGECSITVTDIPRAMDNCAGMISAVTNDPLTYTKQGTHIITWQYNDGNGNIQMQQQQVIIKNPVSLLPRFLVLPDITADCEVTISSRPTIQDYCLGNIAGSTTDSLYYNKPGTHVIYWKYVTSSGDTVIQKQSVIIKNLSLTINAFPNPASNNFNVIVKTCNHNEKINIRVFDVLGRMIETRVVQPFEPIILGSRYPAAAYFIQVIQGTEQITSKLIKIK